MKRPNRKDYKYTPEHSHTLALQYLQSLEKYADYAEDVLEARNDKEFTIRLIEKIIKDEHRKYHKLEKWETVAAIKIYNMLFPNNNDYKTTVELLQLTPEQVEDYLKNI
jgi:hypothetical protein